MKQTTRPELNQEKIAAVCSALDAEGIQESMRERCRNVALAFCAAMLESEVQSLCGARFSRKGGELYHRGGSQETTVILGGGKARLRRPRARNAEGEVGLETLEKLQAQDLLDERIRESMLLGVSTRNYGRVVNGYAKKLGVSKSSVSRAFKRASQKELDIINMGRLDEHEFVAIMLDGIEVADTMIVAAPGYYIGAGESADCPARGRQRERRGGPGSALIAARAWV